MTTIGGSGPWDQSHSAHLGEFDLALQRCGGEDRGGAQGAPDIYEEAVPRLELVARQKLGDTLKLGFEATNLIDPEIRYTQGDRLVSRLRTGRKFSVSIGADF